MSKGIKIDNVCTNNVVNIELSEELKALLLCRAQMSDIFNGVSNIIASRYSGSGYNEIFDNFCNSHCDLDRELMKIISSFIEVTMIESDYTEM